jgi:hypothetical protein
MMHDVLLYMLRGVLAIHTECTRTAHSKARAHVDESCNFSVNPGFEKLWPVQSVQEGQKCCVVLYYTGRVINLSITSSRSSLA